MNKVRQIFQNKLLYGLGLAMLLLLSIAEFSCLGLGPLIFLRDEQWNLQEIQTNLGVSIPQEAQDLKYASGTNRYVHVELSFSASPGNILHFANHFCGGVLHPGYDPFNAINVDQSVSGSVKIDMIDYITLSYYSYSPRTSGLKVGVFCYLYDGLFWVLVDETNPALYTVKFRYRADRSRIYADVKPVANFPIMVRGLMPELHNSYSADRFICLDLDPDAVSAQDKKWSSLIGATIRFLIDGKPMTDAYVTKDGRLARKDGKSNYSDPDSDLFKYCLIVWTGGLHRMTVQIPLTSGGNASYSWVFRDEENASCGNRYPDNDCY